jgi:nucleoside-diphosphate-sugar epimerase
MAARHSGAVLVTTGNLYPYGPVDQPMREGMAEPAPGQKARVRARMWADALAAHRAGTVRAVEVRGSDYIGPDGVNGHMGERVVPRLLAGKAVRVLGSPDQPHSWTYTPDVAAALVAVAGREDAWGRAWHVPTNPARTQREVVHDLCRAAGVATVGVASLPPALLRLVGWVDPTVRALGETRYQFERPYVLDSRDAQHTLGLRPTPWDEVCRRTVQWYAGQLAHAG